MAYGVVTPGYGAVTPVSDEVTAAYGEVTAAYGEVTAAYGAVTAVYGGVASSSVSNNSWSPGVGSKGTFLTAPTEPGGGGSVAATGDMVHLLYTSADIQTLYWTYQTIYM